MHANAMRVIPLPPPPSSLGGGAQGGPGVGPEDPEVLEVGLHLRRIQRPGLQRRQAPAHRPSGGVGGGGGVGRVPSGASGTAPRDKRVGRSGVADAAGATCTGLLGSMLMAYRSRVKGRQALSGRLRGEGLKRNASHWD